MQFGETPAMKFTMSHVVPAALLAALSLCSSAPAVQVTLRFTATVNMINPAQPPFPLTLAGVTVGAPILGTITYDTLSPTVIPPGVAPWNLSTGYALVNAKCRLVIGGVSLNAWNGPFRAYVWNDDPIGLIVPIADGLLFSNVPIQNENQFRLGNIGGLSVNLFASEALPGGTVAGPHVLELGGAGAGTTYLRSGTISTLALVPNCPADVTGEGQVNVTDLLAVIGAWGATGLSSSIPADISHDGQVNVTDLLAVISAWGACP